KADLAAQLLQAEPDPLAPLGALERREQAAGVRWRAQEVGRLDQAGQLVGRDDRHVWPAAALNQDRLPIVDRAVEVVGEARPRLAVAGLDHGRLLRTGRWYGRCPATVQPARCPSRTSAAHTCPVSWSSSAVLRRPSCA